MAVVALAAVGFALAGLAGRVRGGGLAAIVLGVLSGVSGLAGTVLGLVGSFATVSAVDPSRKAAVLSGGISQAMASSAVGLVGGVLAIALGIVAHARRRR